MYGYFILNQQCKGIKFLCKATGIRRRYENFFLILCKKYKRPGSAITVVVAWPFVMP